MLPIDVKKNPALLSVLIAIIFPMLVFSAVFFAIPSPYTGYYDYGLYETKESCEKAGYEWAEDAYGEFCDVFTYSAQAEAELELKMFAYTVAVALTTAFIGAVAVLASLFLVKNRTIAYGFLGGGSIVLFGVVSLTALAFPPAFILFLLLALAALVYWAMKNA